MISHYCRSCGAPDLKLILDLGETPLANSLLSAAHRSQPEARFPLTLVYCETCSLVQINYSVPPEALFSHYLYLSSFSTTMLAHSQALVERLIDEQALTTTSQVVEIASNDGYLLQYYQHHHIPVLGIEPAKNIATVARDRGIPTRIDFFSLQLAEQLQSEGMTADIIHANNVLAHVPDLNGFVHGLKTILKPKGLIVIEAPYVKDLIDQVEFDTIYHEHLCYFSLTALDRLFRQYNLTIVRAERIAIHGGSLRIFATHSDDAVRDASVQHMLAEENRWGVDQYDFYHDFGQRVQNLRNALRALLASLKAEGKHIAAYGASAKGSTLLNYCGIGSETLDFIADRSTFKQGLYAPGTHLPIYPPTSLLEHQPDYVLLLAWNFADEIMAQQDQFRQRGGKFIIPVPQPRIT